MRCLYRCPGAWQKSALISNRLMLQLSGSGRMRIPQGGQESPHPVLDRIQTLGLRCRPSRTGTQVPDSALTLPFSSLHPPIPSRKLGFTMHTPIHEGDEKDDGTAQQPPTGHVRMAIVMAYTPIKPFLCMYGAQPQCIWCNMRLKYDMTGPCSCCN